MNTKQNTILLVEEDPKYVLLVKRATYKANLSASFQLVGDVETAKRYLSGQAGQTHLVNKTASISTSPGSIALMVAY